MQIFPPAFNTVSRVCVFGAALLIGGGLWLVTVTNGSPLVSRVGVTRSQPLSFSHETHVGELGMDCRFCHSTVEKAAFASLPTTRTCMGCHSEVLADSPFLQPLRTSFEEDRSIPWTKVHDLPDFVHFDHAIHVRKGVGCTTCHGQVDRMPRVAQGSTLQMAWCLDCHFRPAAFLRADDEVFDVSWRPSPDQTEKGAERVRQRSIETDQLTDCSICHQ